MSQTGYHAVRCALPEQDRLLLRKLYINISASGPWTKSKTRYHAVRGGHDTEETELVSNTFMPDHILTGFLASLAISTPGYEATAAPAYCHYILSPPGSLFDSFHIIYNAEMHYKK